MDAEDLRAVRIFACFALGVMLAMHGDPFPGHHSGGEPHPEAEEMAGQCMQYQSAVSLRSVQVYRDRGDFEMRQYRVDEIERPPGQIEEAREDHLRHRAKRLERRRAL